jgi:hypothetical protein
MMAGSFVGTPRAVLERFGVIPSEMTAGSITDAAKLTRANRRRERP